MGYLAVPLKYRIWQKKESKLELTASIVRQVMPEFSKKKNVIILSDSWYVKKAWARYGRIYKPRFDWECQV